MVGKSTQEREGSTVAPGRSPTAVSCKPPFFLTPEGMFREDLPERAPDRLRREGGRLIREIRFAEKIRLDAGPLDRPFGLQELALVRHRTKDDRGDVVGVTETDARFVGRVGGLTDLNGEREVGTDENVEVLRFIDLCHGRFSFHGLNSTPRPGLRQLFRACRS